MYNLTMAKSNKKKKKIKRKEKVIINPFFGVISPTKEN